MVSIFRRCPGRLSLQNFVKQSSGVAWQVANDFFEASGATYYGILKRWTGGTWLKEPLKTYLASSWQSKPLKRWTGTEWVLIDTTGV